MNIRKSLFKGNRIGLSFILFSLVSFAHIPDRFFPHIFDKNAAPEFITLAICASVMSILILVHGQSFQPQPKLLYALYFIIGVAVTSAFLSPSVISSFTGDTGRYVGVISLFSLIVVAIFHSQFGFRELETLLSYYLVVIVFQGVIGIAQKFKLVEMPGDQGMTGTFGNQDFYVAFLGISAPIFLYIFMKSTLRKRIFIGSGFLITCAAGVMTGPIQIYIIYGVTLLGFFLYQLRNRIPRYEISLNVRTFLGFFGIVIWAEFIFLFPFIGHFVPILGNDTQVKIRANFWLAGMRQFFSHPFFGVGPDNYGNYYEKFRTVSDAQTFPTILSNDAHSASVQSFATLGMAGILGFLILIAFLVRALCILWDTHSENRKEIYFLGLFIFVYLTNSFISPMVLPSKYLFWGICGWIIGQVYRSTDIDFGVFSIRTPISLMMAAILFVSTNFAYAQYSYAQSFEKYAKNQKGLVNYSFNPYIPCFMYFEAQFQMKKNSNISAIEELALQQTASNSRCVSSRIILTQIYAGTNQTQKWGEQIRQLLDIAPTRSQVLTLAMEYAIKTGDKALADSIQKRFGQLGLIYVPGKSG